MRRNIDRGFHRRKIIAALVALLLAFAPIPASAGWVQAGIDWQAWPSESGVPDHCFCNCGAGCSSSVNPCGGPPQYWDLQFVAGPDFFQSGVEQMCSGSSLLQRTWNEYHAIGQWTYHGWVKPGCISHDLYCNPWLVGCVLFFGCGDPGWTSTWSYNEWMRGYTTSSWEYIGELC